jgi:hypothetical protein
MFAFDAIVAGQDSPIEISATVFLKKAGDGFAVRHNLEHFEANQQYFLRCKVKNALGVRI